MRASDVRLGRRHNSISPLFALHLKPTICEITAMGFAGSRTDTFWGVLGVMKLSEGRGRFASAFLLNISEFP